MKEFLQLDRNLKLRMLTMFLVAILNSSVLPNMTIYYSHYFGTLVTGGLLIAVSVASFLAGLYGGHLADVYGRKPVMIGGGLLIAVGYAVAAAMNSPWIHDPQVTFIGFLVAGVGSSGANPAEQAMIIDASTPANRQYVYSLSYWIVNISVMIGSALGGWFFRDYLFELLTGMIVVSIVNLGIVSLGMREIEHATAAVSNSLRSLVHAYREVMTDQRYLLFLIGWVFACIISSQPDYYLAVHLGADFHPTTIMGLHLYGQRMLSMVTITNTVMIVVLMGVFTRISRGWRLARTYTLGVTLSALGFASAFVGDRFWPLILSAVILTLGEMFVVPSSQTLRADMMNPARIGVYSGAMMAVNPLASVIAGLLVSVSGLLDNWGMAAVMILCGLASIGLVGRSAGMPATY